MADWSAWGWHYTGIIMSAITPQITSVSIVCSVVCWGSDQIKLKNSVSLVFVRGIHRRPMNSLHKEPVTRKMFPFDNVIMKWFINGALVGMGFIWYTVFHYLDVCNFGSVSNAVVQTLLTRHCCNDITPKLILSQFLWNLAHPLHNFQWQNWQFSKIKVFQVYREQDLTYWPTEADIRQ